MKLQLLPDQQLAEPFERSPASSPPTDIALSVAPAMDDAVREPDVSEREKLALAFWVKLSRAHNAIAAHASADTARHGMTLAEFGILEALYHRGPMLLGEVQRRILVSSGGITFLVDRLTAKGLVERRNCPGDKRARYAALTEKGEQFVAHAFPAHAEVLSAAMVALDDSELAAAGALLRQAGMGAAQS